MAMVAGAGGLSCRGRQCGAADGSGGCLQGVPGLPRLLGRVCIVITRPCFGAGEQKTMGVGQHERGDDTDEDGAHTGASGGDDNDASNATNIEWPRSNRRRLQGRDGLSVVVDLSLYLWLAALRASPPRPFWAWLAERCIRVLRYSREMKLNSH